MNKFVKTISILLPIVCATLTDGFKTSNYEIVPIKWPTIQKRSTRSTVPISLKVFNNQIDLNLKPVDDLIVNPNTPIYNIVRKKARLHVQTKRVFDDIKMEIYEDEKNLASVVVNIYPNGVKAIENAIIGISNLVIRPATNNFLSKLDKNNTSRGKNSLYVVYSRQQTIGHSLNPLERTANMIDEKFSKYPLNIPDVVYPEVLVIVDYYLAKNLGENSIVPYMLTFWNQVDLMYRSLDSPKYRINIAGIVIPQNLDAVDYISSVRAQYRSNHLDFQKVLKQCFKWLYIHKKSIPVNNYDVAITMTSSESANINDLSGLINGQEIGLAMVSGACQVDHGSKNVIKAGMILDNGAFSGVTTAAHELGHTLGAYHDGGRSCPERKGYLMAPFASNTIHRFEWSKCSLSHFKNFLKTSPKCLYNKPRW